MDRPWEPFLTEQDRALLRYRGDRRKGVGTRPALLLVDLYRWVFGDECEPLLTAVQTWPGSCGPAAWAALPHIQRLLAAARASRLPVIHVTGLEAIVGWRDSTVRGQRYEESTPEARDRLRRRYDIIDEVAPVDGEAVIRKSSPSAFWGTPLVGHLRYLDVDTLIVAGESTSGCVRATVVDGRTHRFHMLVAQECVFDRHEASHAMNLFDMDQKYADVVAVDDAIAYISSYRPSGQPEQPRSDKPAEASDLTSTSQSRR